MLTAIGLMSGTSLDGIDLALLRTDGEAGIELGATASLDYADEERALLREALADARTIVDRQERPGAVARAEAMITERHAALVECFLGDAALKSRDVDVVGFHGQTVLHRPEARLTVQIGNGTRLADRLGIAVVHDLRAADVAAGGQGAPFVPAFHAALVRAGTFAGPVAVLNLGGVGNVTFVPTNGPPIAFDTGPGNALIDDMMLERKGIAVDRDGEAGLAGRVDEGALATLMQNPYFDMAPPKSLDRNAFSRAAVSHLSTVDAAATLAAFTAASVASATRFLPSPPRNWIVCGGGARNAAILRALSGLVDASVQTADEVGWSSSMMEAQAFAYLAVRALKKLPLSFPSTTGVPRPMTGGVIARPAASAVPA
jgi:anhydro-N-acetylmuramic acid kinase